MNDIIAIKSHRKSIKSDDIGDGMVTVNINLLKEKKAIFHTLKSKAFDNSGIIFGGMIRDEIIAEHFKSVFNTYAKTQEGKEYIKGNFSAAYWDTKIHPETASRTLVANDMDVFFTNIDDADNFITEIRDIFPNAEEINSGPLKYGGPLSNLTGKKITLSYNVGKTFTFKGYDIEIPIDIVIGSNRINMEPPFNNLDMLCNGFIEDKTHTKKLSINTGTKIDKFNLLERTIASAKIMKDIIEFKTEICKKNYSSKHDLFYTINRYNKMINRGWNITNLPYKIVNNKNEECIGYDCCICSDSFDEATEKDQIVISNNGAKTHHGCLIKYMNVQIENNAKNLVCPHKSIITYNHIRVNNWAYYKSF
jgi:hypothetical protein